MKKLKLKKEVVARITKDEMIYLKGGYGNGEYGGGEIQSQNADICKLSTEDLSCIMTCDTNNNCIWTKPRSCAPCM